MIAAVARALAHPAEAVPVGLGILSLMACGWWVRRGGSAWVAALPAGGLALLAAGLAGVRGFATAAAAADVGRAQLAAHVAREHALAAQGVWWWLLWAAAVATLPAWVAGPRERVGLPSGLAAAGLAAVALSGGGALGWCGLGLLAVGSLPRERNGLRWLGGGLLWASAWASAEAGLADTWIMNDPADVAAMVPAWTREAVVAALAVVWGVAEAAQRRAGARWWLGTGAMLALGGFLWGRGAVAAQSWGPPALDGYGVLPTVPPASERFIGGCVWTWSRGRRLGGRLPSRGGSRSAMGWWAARGRGRTRRTSPRWWCLRRCGRVSC